MDQARSKLEIRRLRSGDEVLAARLFMMMSAVFGASDEGGEEGDDEPLGAEDVRRLLARADFFAVAALEDGVVVGGVTAHVLPMTRNRSHELFIYDLAVRDDRQRRGIGRALVTVLRGVAASEGVATSFVLADDEDGHALSFYRRLGGDEASTTMFTFTGAPSGKDDATGR